ncbi:response regulator [Paenibacillus silviterrae]|uniref:response regulator n=1 Tax=Paenibacillus silviterrae TaxID=3242194 RepID=UPI002543269B|nr:response regulator [Paenibacillus chinjuensis]
MNIIIVDDEAQIRRWIELLVRKIELPVHIVAMCSNGKEALDACITGDVDIVITDIKMPVMDGIELIHRVKEVRPSIPFLILSSYSEFHYATEALKAGANDYLLKAEITAPGLAEALSKLWSGVEKERNRELELSRLKNTLNGNQYAIRSFYFAELLKGKMAAIQEFDERMSTLRIRLNRNRIVLMAIRSDDRTEGRTSDSVKIADPDLLDSAVINIIDETLLTEAGSGCSFVYEQGFYIAVFNYEHWKGRTLREITLQYAHRIAGYVSGYLGLSVSIGISLPSLDISGLGQQLQEASRALHHKLFYGRRTISWYSDEPVSVQSAAPGSGHLYLERLSAELERGQFVQALESLRDALKQVGEAMLWSEKEVKAFCVECAFLMQRTLRKHNPSSGLFMGPEAPHEEIAQLVTFEQVSSWLLSRFERDMKEVKESQPAYSEAIRKVCEYMKTQYSQEVSLQQAAHYVHLNRNYLSELFKKETGISFNDYLTQIRIEKAKELLLKGETKIGLLAEQIGYPDGSYMSKVFKKVTGMTPMEFKQRKQEKM